MSFTIPYLFAKLENISPLNNKSEMKQKELKVMWALTGGGHLYNLAGLLIYLLSTAVMVNPLCIQYK
jgi:hypothetical protein